MRIVRLAPAVVVVLSSWVGCATEQGPHTETAIERPWPELVRVAVGARFSCTIDDTAAVQCWGDVPAEVAGHDPADRLRAPHAIPRLTSVHELASDDDTLCARTAERRVLCWGPDVHGDGEAEHPVELGELHGATSIAVVDGRVCGVLAARVRCVGTNAPRLRERIASGAWLEAAADAVCVLDGLGPARCLETGGTTLWPITGSEGAVSIALARGVCVTTADGHLRCDDAAERIVEASLRDVEGIDDARFVRGAADVRCVARGASVACSLRDGDDLTFEGSAASLDVGAGADMGRTAGRFEHRGVFWHACAHVEGVVSCAGVNEVGEVTGHTPEAVQRVYEIADARASLAVLAEDAWLLTAGGALLRVPLARPEAAVRDTRVAGWLDLAKCDADVLCGRAEGDRLVSLAPGRSEVLPRVVTGFVATGAPFPAAGRVCAPSDAATVCVDRRDHVTRVADLASPVSFEDGLCGLRGGTVVCASRSGAPALERAIEPLERVADAPSDLVQLFGGAEQLFAARRGGSWIAMGHNGVGQLGLAPSVPVSVPTSTSASAFTRMAFAYHLSCGWNDVGPIVCAGLDDALRPRVLPPSSGTAERPPERGDGLWTPIPSVSEIVAVDSNGQVTCALDARGGLWCWGGRAGGAGPRTYTATRVELASR